MRLQAFGRWLKSQLASLKVYLDPDRNWKGPDKVEHFLSFAALAFLMCLVGERWARVLYSCTLVALAFELGQTDNARSTWVNAHGLFKPALGEVGYGFGLIDLVFDYAGVLVGTGFYYILRAVV